MNHKENLIIDDIGHYLSGRIPHIHELSEKFKSFHTGLITSESIIYWLLQFESLERIKIAFKLLTNIIYLNHEKIVSNIISSIKKIENIDKVIFCPIGGLCDSASMLIYSIGKKMNFPENELLNRFITIENISNDKENNTPIVFIDDNITSGTQLFKFFDELFTNTVEKREHLVTPVSDAVIKIIKLKKIYYCVSIDLGGMNIENKIREKYGIENFQIISGLKDYNNYLDYGNSIWENEVEVDKAKEMIKEISLSLYYDKINIWSNDLINDRIFGYGNLGKLTVFSHNIPKSLLPIFWKFGYYKSNPWFPLFVERVEWETYKSEILQLNPLIQYVAKNIISGLFGKQLPSCSGYIITRKLNTKEKIFNIPNDITINKAIQYKLKNLKLLNHMGRPNAFYEGVFSPSIEEYARFNKEVDEYNKNIAEYKNQIYSKFPIIMSNFSLPIRIYNSGNGTANEVILIITLPDEIDFYENIFDHLPEKPSEPKKPEFGKINIRPEINYLASISKSLKNDVIEKKHRIKITYDNNTKIIVIYLGKILQHTFRDYEIKTLVLKKYIPSIRIEYKIICEESTNPINETFLLKFEKEEQINNLTYNLIHDDEK